MNFFFFKATVKLSMKHRDGWDKAQHVATDIRLDVSPNLKHKQYLENDLPTKDGSQALTVTLIQGLVSNIHNAHHRGYRDSAEHMRYIIAELEKGFAEVPKVGTSMMDNEIKEDPNFKG